MELKSVKLIDKTRAVVATAQVKDEGAYYGGAIDLASTPPDLRALFDEFEELVNDPVFSLLDDIQGKIGAHVARVIFDDGFEAVVTDVQVFPTTGDVSFRLVGTPVLAASK